MKNIIKRLTTIVMAIAMCVCFANTAFASEAESDKHTSMFTIEATSDGISSIVNENGETVNPSVLRSTISGYG